MSNERRKIIAANLVILAVFLLPAVKAYAQLTPIPCPPGLNCSANFSVNNLIVTIINWLLGLAFSLSVLFLIIGGFWFITSAGNAETADKAKATIINALVGLVLIILSYAIINAIAGALSNSQAPAP